MYERKTNRLKNFDYSAPNYYFVTICVKERKELFGEVENQGMRLNTIGKIAQDFWQKIPEHYLNVKLDECIFMPNHMHGILIFQPVRAGIDLCNPMMEAGSLRYGDLSQVVAAFKSISSKAIRKAGLADFNWQKSFYDHVIRKDKSVDRIREYIRNNPLKWELDRNNLENIWM